MSQQTDLTHCACAESAAVGPQAHPTADDQYVTEQLKLMAVSLEQDADRDQHEDSESEPSSGDEEDGEERGLEAFEDVLSSWLTAAHSKTSQTLMKAQASLPLTPPMRAGGAAGGGRSTLARIQEQQQQLMKEEEAGSALAASKLAQEPAGKVRSSTVVKASAASVCAKPASKQEEEEEPESPTGIEGWKDVLSNWMTTAGVTATAQQAQQAGSKTNAAAANKAAQQKDSKLGKAAEAPSWLADVSSDDEEEAGGGSDVRAPQTLSVSKQLLQASHGLLNEADKQRAASFYSAQQRQPQHAQQGPVSSAPPGVAFPASSPLQGYSVPLHGLMGSSGVSSQDVRLDGDLLSRTRSDPAAMWNNSAPGFPPRPGQEPRLPPAVATSLPAPVYPADQGLPPQVHSAALPL